MFIFGRELWYSTSLMNKENIDPTHFLMNDEKKRNSGNI